MKSSHLKRLLNADARWSERLSVARDPGLLRSTAAFLAHSGDSWFIWPPLLLMAILTEMPWNLWAGRYLAASIGIALIVLTIKVLVRRRRPEGEWGKLYRNHDPHSFPSGHAARAALLATLSFSWGPTWLVPLMVVWGPSVAIARVAMGVHYISDILAGVLLGIVGGILAPLILP